MISIQLHHGQFYEFITEIKLLHLAEIFLDVERGKYPGRSTYIFYQQPTFAKILQKPSAFAWKETKSNA